MKTKYFRVKFGYGVDDFIVVDDTEVSKALRAQINGTVAIFREGSVSGKNILAIVPDINKLMGWNRTYQPTAEDYGEIPEKSLNEHRELLENTTLQITGKMPEEKMIKIQNSAFVSETKQLANKFKV